MKPTISCDIIRDLLPIYLENLASEASAAAIEEHLQNCKYCRAIYEDMKKPLPIETQQAEVVDSLKKFRRSLKLRNIVILLLAIGILISVLKVFVIGSVTEFGEVDIESWTYNTDGSVTLDATMRSGRSMGRYKLIPQDENGQINITIYSVANLPLRSSNDFSITIPFGEGASIIWRGKDENIVAITETAFSTYIGHVSEDNTQLFGDWITNINEKSKIQNIIDGACETTILQTDTIRSVSHIMIIPGSNRVSIEQEWNKEYEVRYYVYELNGRFYLEELKHFFGEEYEIRENTTTRDIVATIPNRKYVKEINGEDYAELLQLTRRIEILDELKDSIIYDKETGQLKFTIPKETLSDGKYSILVSGRIKMGENGMSWHAFQEESVNYSWEAGKTYVAEVSSEDLDFILIHAALVNNDGSVLDDGWELTITSD